MPVAPVNFFSYTILYELVMGLVLCYLTFLSLSCVCCFAWALWF